MFRLLLTAIFREQQNINLLKDTMHRRHMDISVINCKMHNDIMAINNSRNM
jgi:peroxiredoxin family protein